MLLIENDINTNPFTPAVHACVPPLPWSVTEADVADPSRCVHPATPSCCQNHLAMQPGTRFLPHMCSRPLAAPCSGIVTCALHTAQLLSLHQASNHHPLVPLIRRTDLRHLAVCSVDPPGCKDIDDALHVRRLPNGNFELGVRLLLASVSLISGCSCWTVHQQHPLLCNAQLWCLAPSHLRALYLLARLACLTGWCCLLLPRLRRCTLPMSPTLCTRGPQWTRRPRSGECPIRERLSGWHVRWGGQGHKHLHMWVMVSAALQMCIDLAACVP